MDIQAASTYHRYIILTVFCTLLSLLLLIRAPLLLSVVLSVVALSMYAFNVFCCYKLASSIGKSPALWAGLGLVGFISGWIPQLFLINATNKIFKARGMKIGFLGGAKKAA